jgi:hypothetical protein
MAKNAVRTSVLFRSYYYEKQSAAGKEEGTIRITNTFGRSKMQSPKSTLIVSMRSQT